MKRSSILLAVVLMASLPAVARASAPGSPEDVVERACEALNHGKIDQFVRAMHPDALAQLRSFVLDVLDVAVKQGKQEQLLGLFLEVSTPEELKTLDGRQMLSAMIGKVTADPDVKQALATTRVEALGRIVEGNDRAYVAYRSRMKFGELNIDRLQAVALLKSGSDWKMTLSDETQGTLAALKQGLAGDPKLPDLSAMKVEPVGHVMDGKRSAAVVYRTIVPMEGSPITKLGAVRVNAGDAAWDSVCKDDGPAVTAFLEKSLGLRRGVATAPPGEPSPGTAAAPEAPKLSPAELAARKARNEKILEEMKTRMEKMRAGRSTARKEAESAASALPAGLTALPSSFLGPDRDRFYDVAPEGGVLVGVRVSYYRRSQLSGPEISSVRPVYRVGEKLVDGKRYGKLIGKEEKALAKPGYAVGGVNSRAGVSLHGFELVFMRVDGDRLKTSDSYTSPWMGEPKFGLKRNVESGDKPPVGLQGRADDEVNALGLIVPE